MRQICTGEVRAVQAKNTDAGLNQSLDRHWRITGWPYRCHNLGFTHPPIMAVAERIPVVIKGETKKKRRLWQFQNDFSDSSRSL